MNNNFKLPKKMFKVQVPPIKCQGIKTKLLSFIAENIKWEGKGWWFEPFLGSGVVLFNINPDRAVISDTNKHIINFYKDIQSGKLDGYIVRNYLEKQGLELSKKGKDFYYEIREKFNDKGNNLDFIFLNRSCFNGVIRFNSKGKYNVPFGHKPNRFSKSYITKIVNQVEAIRKIMKNKDWFFKVGKWENTLKEVNEDDFAYVDPPYIGRHTDYYNNWTEEDSEKLSNKLKELKGGFALSMWKENKYRKNEYITNYWKKYKIRTYSHFYYIGSKESLRNKMEEALIIKSGYDSLKTDLEKLPKNYIEEDQLNLLLD